MPSSPNWNHIHTRTHTHIHAHTYTHTYTHAHTCMHTHTHAQQSLRQPLHSYCCPVNQQHWDAWHPLGTQALCRKSSWGRASNPQEGCSGLKDRNCRTQSFTMTSHHWARQTDTHFTTYFHHNFKRKHQCMLIISNDYMFVLLSVRPPVLYAYINQLCRL